MLPFVYYAPTKVVFGPDTASETGKLVKEQGATKVLIHYGSERVKKSGLVPMIEQQLRTSVRYMRALNSAGRKASTSSFPSAVVLSSTPRRPSATDLRMRPRVMSGISMISSGRRAHAPRRVWY